MASPYWDQKRADAYTEFRYEFPVNSLRDKAVVVAGGTGGLGAATVGLLAAEGARLVVGFRANRARAGNLSRAIQEQFGCAISLVEGDIAAPDVIDAYMAAIQKSGAQLAGAAIFSG